MRFNLVIWRPILVLSLLGVILLSGCSQMDQSGETAEGTAALPAEDELAACTLAFVNDPSTTLDALDTSAALDRRAAESLVAVRADGPIAHLGELRQVAYLGEKGLKRLRRHAANWCQRNPDHAVVGLHDGVGFTSRQVGHTLTIVNTASPEALDAMLANTDARTEIVRAREIMSIADLAALPHVDRIELTALRRAAMAR